jgi:FkbM family methyltransferase
VKHLSLIPEIFKHARANLGEWVPMVVPYRAAVSDRNGEAEFVRVLNNMTGSHIAGSKDSYGPRETFSVPVVDCRPLFDWADLAKLDVEGHEGVLLRCVTSAHLEHLDLICELRGAREAEQVLEHFNALECPIYTQKNDWKPAIRFADMPTKHQEGSASSSASVEVHGLHTNKKRLGEDHARIARARPHALQNRPDAGNAPLHRPELGRGGEPSHSYGEALMRLYVAFQCRLAQETTYG